MYVYVCMYIHTCIVGSPLSVALVGIHPCHTHTHRHKEHHLQSGPTLLSLLSLSFFPAFLASTFFICILMKSPSWPIYSPFSVFDHRRPKLLLVLKKGKYPVYWFSTSLFFSFFLLLFLFPRPQIERVLTQTDIQLFDLAKQLYYAVSLSH
jgi:hypothetical protein